MGRGLGTAFRGWKGLVAIVCGVLLLAWQWRRRDKPDLFDPTLLAVETAIPKPTEILTLAPSLSRSSWRKSRTRSNTER
jgi:hypothetical protein